MDADATLDLSVVVPAYNEQDRLPTMLDETIAFLEARRKNSQQNGKQHEHHHPLYESETFTYEIIVVDDGSSDETTKCARSYAKKLDDPDTIKVITLQQNRGKGGAVRVGVLAARGSYIIFADADGASKFSDIRKLEDYLHKNKDSESNGLVAVGSRAHMEDEAIATRSLFRTILMKGFHLLVWTFCVRTVKDTQCGFKMFSRQAAQLLFNTYKIESWAFDVELLYLAEQTKCNIGEIAINWKEVDGSKIVPVFSWIRMGWDVIRLALSYGLGIYTIPKLKQV